MTPADEHVGHFLIDDGSIPDRAAPRGNPIPRRWLHNTSDCTSHAGNARGGHALESLRPASQLVSKRLSFRPCP